MTLEIRYLPITADQWFPDRCLSIKQPLSVYRIKPETGCPSLSLFYTQGDRKILEDLYQGALERYGCCGHLAWQGDQVIGFNTFFPWELSRRIKFYGWGSDQIKAPGETLIHNCISLINHSKYRRKQIGSNLIKYSLNWGRNNGWKRFEVYNVLPNNNEAFTSEQKSCVSFWEKLGFSVFHTEKASDELNKLYNIHRVFYMYIGLQDNPKLDKILAL
ncbi:MAG: GNAT family N-acetyltransferase [Candidatus Thorarchaeota archaeon]